MKLKNVIKGAALVAFAALLAAPASAGGSDWLTWGGDLQVRHDKLRGGYASYHNGVSVTQASNVRNDSLFTNRLGLNMKAKVAEHVTFTGRLLMYKVSGHTEGGPANPGYFADRNTPSASGTAFATNNAFDGAMGHTAQNNTLLVDQAYGTVNYLFDLPMWFSAGRRPSTGGVPTNIAENRVVTGASGTPGLLVDYAFDGMTLGIAPAFESLPGFAAKLCYGRGYDAGFTLNQNGSKDTDLLGFNMVPYESNDLRLDAQYHHGFNIMSNVPGPNTTTNLGELEALGGGVTYVMRDIPGGDLTVFGHAAYSKTVPNENRVNNVFGLNCGSGAGSADCYSKSGNAFYIGTRYDIKETGTKIGAEFNRGSQDWITFAPAADDIWTSKLGTRGKVYETYIIQELKREKISPKAQVFFKLGWQYYDFDYTYSNNWVGASRPIDNLPTNAQNMQALAPVKNAYDVYTTFEVRF